MHFKEKLKFKFKTLSVDQPKVKAKSVTSSGELLISFSNDMIVPSLENGHRQLQQDEKASVPFEEVIK